MSFRATDHVVDVTRESRSGGRSADELREAPIWLFEASMSLDQVRKTRSREGDHWGSVFFGPMLRKRCYCVSVTDSPPYLKTFIFIFIDTLWTYRQLCPRHVCVWQGHNCIFSVSVLLIYSKVIQIFLF